MFFRPAAAFVPPGPEAKLPPWWGIPFSLIGMVLLIGAGLLLPIGVIGAFASQAGLSGETRVDDWRYAVPVQLVAALGVVLGIRLWLTSVEHRAPESAGLRRPLWRVDAAELRWLGLGVLFAVASVLVFAALGDEDPKALPRALRALVRVDRVLAGAAVILPLAIAGAAMEEVLFRGWGLSVLSPRIGVGGAVLVSSLLFGAAHIEPSRYGDLAAILSLLAYAALGAALAVLSLWQGHVYGAIAFHAGFNLLLATLGHAEGGFDAQASWDQVVGGQRGSSDLLIAGATLLLNELLLLTLLRAWLRR